MGLFETLPESWWCALYGFASLLLSFHILLHHSLLLLLLLIRLPILSSLSFMKACIIKLVGGHTTGVTLILSLPHQGAIKVLSLAQSCSLPNMQCELPVLSLGSPFRPERKSYYVAERDDKRYAFVHYGCLIPGIQVYPR